MSQIADMKKGPFGPLVCFALTVCSVALSYAKPLRTFAGNALAQAGAEALDAGAGFFKQRIRRRIGNAEVRSEAECRTVHDGDAFGFQQFGDEIFVGLDDLASFRLLADQVSAGRIDV